MASVIRGWPAYSLKDASNKLARRIYALVGARGSDYKDVEAENEMAAVWGLPTLNVSSPKAIRHVAQIEAAIPTEDELAVFEAAMFAAFSEWWVGAGKPVRLVWRVRPCMKWDEDFETVRRTMGGILRVGVLE